MKFEMWSFWHFFYILSPALIMIPLYFLLRKRSEKTKYIVGAIIGVASLAVITTRCIYYYVTHGFHPQEIPLQICHFGNIMVFIALLFKSKIAGCISWSLNLPAAFSSLVLADSLAKYENVWDVLPQCYIWGHLLIVVGALYPIILKTIRFRIKDFYIGLGVLFALLITAIILNSYFNDTFFNEDGTKKWFINYFYIYNSKGVPFKFIQDLFPRAHYGWFTIDWAYTLILIAIFVPFIYGVSCIPMLFYRKDKDYKTTNVYTDIKNYYLNKKQVNA